MKLTQTGRRLLPAVAVLVAISLLANAPASAQCYAGPGYGGYAGYAYHPSYDYSCGGGYLDYGYPYLHRYGVYHHSYHPYYRSYRYRSYWRGYPSYYGGVSGYWGRGLGYWAGGCY